MRTVFADTSALYALLVSSDVRHDQARRSFARLEAAAAPLLTTSYVLVETASLLGRRVGLGAIRSFHEDFVPLLEVVWVDAGLHHTGLAYLLKKEARGLSLVDAVSFVVMMERNVEIAFAYDRHYVDEGFQLTD